MAEAFTHLSRYGILVYKAYHQLSLLALWRCIAWDGSSSHKRVCRCAGRSYDYKYSLVKALGRCNAQFNAHRRNAAIIALLRAEPQPNVHSTKAATDRANPVRDLYGPTASNNHPQPAASNPTENAIRRQLCTSEDLSRQKFRKLMISKTGGLSSNPVKSTTTHAGGVMGKVAMITQFTPTHYVERQQRSTIVDDIRPFVNLSGCSG